jgi:hypothetical protein
MQVSQQLQQSQPCSQAALLADAQAQAKQVAAAGCVSAGPILSMIEGGGAVGSFYYGSAVGTGLPVISSVYTAPQATCSLTVQFQLR